MQINYYYYYTTILLLQLSPLTLLDGRAVQTDPGVVVGDLPVWRQSFRCRVLELEQQKLGMATFERPLLFRMMTMIHRFRSFFLYITIATTHSGGGAGFLFVNLVICWNGVFCTPDVHPVASPNQHCQGTEGCVITRSNTSKSDLHLMMMMTTTIAISSLVSGEECFYFGAFQSPFSITRFCSPFTVHYLR